MALPGPVDTVARRYREHDCDVVAIIADPADQQTTIYATVTRAGVLLGSYYPADPIRQTGWHVVHSDPLRHSADPCPVESETDALIALITRT